MSTNIDRIVDVAYTIGATPLWVFTCDALSKGLYEEAMNCIRKEDAQFANRKANYKVEMVQYDHPLIFTLFESNKLASAVANSMYFGYYRTAYEKLEEAIKDDE